MADPQDLTYILNKLPQEVRTLLAKYGRVRTFEKGSMIYYPGAVCDYVPVILSGEIKVYLVSDTGREILLYSVREKETCMLTNLSVLKEKPYPAYAVSSKISSILLVEANTARQLFESYQAWRDFVLDMFVKDGWLLASRMSDVISRRVDKRLAELLLRRLEEGNVIKTTHEEIAKDLGTAREVVTRILKRFESQGMLSVGRGKIVILDTEALRNFLSSVT